MYDMFTDVKGLWSFIFAVRITNQIRKKGGKFIDIYDRRFAGSFWLNIYCSTTAFSSIQSYHMQYIIMLDVSFLLADNICCSFDSHSSFWSLDPNVPSSLHAFVF